MTTPSRPMAIPTREISAAAHARARSADVRYQDLRLARLAEAAGVPFTLIVEHPVAEILRSLACDHGQPAHQVFALGFLMALASGFSRLWSAPVLGKKLPEYRAGGCVIGERRTTAAR